MDTERLSELEAALEVKVASQKEIADSIEVKDDTIVVEEGQKEAFQAGMAEIRELKQYIDANRELAGVDEYLQQPQNTSAAAEADAAAPAPLGRKSLGDAFLDSPEFKALQGGAAGATMHSPFQVKDVYSTLPSGAVDFGGTDRDGIVDSAKRAKRVRDLFPSRSTSSAVVEFFRVDGYTNNASVVPEYSGGNFGAKPQTDLTFVGEQAPVRTIAHWEAAHRNVLADEPQLRSIIDNELLYGLRLSEDNQILSGTGTGEDLLGILANTNIQSYDWSAGALLPVPDTKADAVRRAATLAYLAHYEPTGVIVHPSDWEDMELTKNSEGTYLVAMSISDGAEQRIWRIPVIDTPAIPSGTALVGAFGTGAQLYDREAASIRISEQHSDFFVRNAVVVLAEERLALATKRPESFVEVVFDAAPS